MATEENPASRAREWPCGCVTGARLCWEAVRLWKELGLAFRRGTARQQFTEYETACCAFDAHYRRQDLDAPAAATAEGLARNQCPGRQLRKRGRQQAGTLERQEEDDADSLCDGRL